jgi:hypothetical protein
VFHPDVMFPFIAVNKLKCFHIEIINPSQIVKGSYNSCFWNIPAVGTDFERSYKTRKLQLNLRIYGIRIIIFVGTRSVDIQMSLTY